MLKKILLRCVYLLIIGGFIGAPASYSQQIKPYKEGDFLIAAHRGFHLDVPENSSLAIKKAIEQGVDIVETDVRLSKDGIPILMHDETLSRTTTGKGNVNKMSFAELKELNLLFKGEKTAYRVLSLAEALNIGKGKIIFDLDLKIDQITAVIEVVEQTDAWESCVFFDANWSTLDKILAQHPNWHVMPRAHNAAEAKEAYRKFTPWAVHVDPSFAEKQLSEYLHKKKTHVWINSLGYVDVTLSIAYHAPFVNLLETKPNIVQTDVPTTLQFFLMTNGKLSQPLVKGKVGR